MKKDRIFLTGFMGAGKSTLGKIVANVLGWEFADLDKKVEEQAGLKVAEIFKSKGEQEFRQIEARELQQLCAQTRVVIALGGGAILQEGNFNLIMASGILVYLKSAPEQIFLRLRYKMDRPLFQTPDQQPLSRDQALARIADLLAQREKYYSQAHIILNTDKQYVGRSADMLLKILKQKFKIA